MARLFLVLSLVAGLVAADTDPQIWGFGEHTTGGALASGKSIYTVKNFNELRTALKNGGKPDDPKIIYIGKFPLGICQYIYVQFANVGVDVTDGVLNGDYLADGTLATEAYYARNTKYTWERYLNSFNSTLKAILGSSTDPADAEELQIIEAQETHRQAASKEQEKQIAVRIGNNTSIQSAEKAKIANIQNAYLAINFTDNVILR